MKKPFYSIVNNKSDQKGRIDIYGVIGPDWWGEGNEAKKFIRDLSILENQFERIDIHINSPGGSIWDGLPIFNAIRASKKDIHTYVDGIALSMGAMIALAGHTVHAAKGSIMMLHNASGAAWGNSKQMRSTADMLDTHDKVLSELIADRTGKTPEDVLSLWMNYEDTFFSSQEALEAKLIDVIEDYNADEMPENVQNMSIHQVAAFYDQRQEEPNPHLLNKIFSHVKNQFSNMKFNNVVALVGVQNATQEQLDQANADLTAEGITNYTIVPESLINESANVTAERNQLTTQLEAANTARTTAESNLATANTSLATANARITELEAKVAAAPGATHKPATGKDEVIQSTEDAEFQALMDALPHNQKADRMLG